MLGSPRGAPLRAVSSFSSPSPYSALHALRTRVEGRERLVSAGMDREISNLVGLPQPH